MHIFFLVATRVYMQCSCLNSGDVADLISDKITTGLLLCVFGRSFNSQIIIIDKILQSQNLEMTSLCHLRAHTIITKHYLRAC